MNPTHDHRSDYETCQDEAMEYARLFLFRLMEENKALYPNFTIFDYRASNIDDNE